MFPNRQIFLEHLSLPQAGSVANIPESGVQHLGNKCKVIAQKTIRHRPYSLIAKYIPFAFAFHLDVCQGYIEMHLSLRRIAWVPIDYPLGPLTQHGSDWIRSSIEPSKGI
jgi:hypothetical protein